MSLPLCPSKICISGFNSPPQWPHHLPGSTPTHPPHRVTSNPHRVSASTQSGIHTSTPSFWGNGGGPRGGRLPPRRPPPQTGEVILEATDSTRPSDQRGGRLGIAPNFLPFPSNRATKVNIVIFASCVEPMYTTGAVSWSLQVWGWGRYYSAQLDIDELSESGDWESTFSYCLLPSHAYQ